VTPVLKQLHWLPIESRIRYKVLLLCYKIICGLAPRYFEGILLLKTNQRQMRSSGLVQYSVKRTRTGFGDRSFSSCTPLLWTSLPQRLKQSQNVDIFKRRLKMWLFNDHFGGVALWLVFGKALYKCIFIIIIIDRHRVLERPVLALFT
jgi:hypothetical protein